MVRPISRSPSWIRRRETRSPGGPPSAGPSALWRARCAPDAGDVGLDPAVVPHAPWASSSEVPRMSRSTPPVSRRDRRAQARYERPVAPRRKPTRKTGERPAWRSPVLLTSVGAVLVGALIIAFAGGIFGGATKDLVTPPTSYSGITQTGESVGAANAPVVIELFS